MTYTNPSIRRCPCGHPSYSAQAHTTHLAKCPVALGVPVPVYVFPAEPVIDLTIEDTLSRCRRAAYELRNMQGTGIINLPAVIGILEGAA